MRQAAGQAVHEPDERLRQRKHALEQQLPGVLEPNSLYLDDVVERRVNNAGAMPQVDPIPSREWQFKDSHRRLVGRRRSAYEVFPDLRPA